MHKSLFLGALTLLITVMILSPSARTESVSQWVKKEDQIREEMIKISREIGVACTECHNVSNFTDGSKKSYVVGKEHMKITSLLRERGFDGKKGPEATCFMCHRGKLKPDYKEPASNKAQ